MAAMTLIGFFIIHNFHFYYPNLPLTSLFTPRSTTNKHFIQKTKRKNINVLSKKVIVDKKKNSRILEHEYFNKNITE